MLAYAAEGYSPAGCQKTEQLQREPPLRQQIDDKVLEMVSKL